MLKYTTITIFGDTRLTRPNLEHTGQEMSLVAPQHKHTQTWEQKNTGTQDCTDLKSQTNTDCLGRVKTQELALFVAACLGSTLWRGAAPIVKLDIQTFLEYSS